MIRMPYQKQLKLPITFPVIMSKSRDYNSIEFLLYSVFYYFYNQSVESKNIHNPYKCDVNLLPMLADFCRYQYTDVEDIKHERDIIASVSQLHHNKGTVTGITYALDLCKKDKENAIQIPWFYDAKNNTVIVIVDRLTKTYKMLELLKLVIPLGTKIIRRPGFFVHAKEEIKMHSWSAINFGNLMPEKQYYVQPNNFWHTEWDAKTQLYTNYIDEQWALSNPNDSDPQELGINGGTRIGSAEVAGNDVSGPETEE